MLVPDCQNKRLNAKTIKWQEMVQPSFHWLVSWLTHLSKLTQNRCLFGFDTELEVTIFQEKLKCKGCYVVFPLRFIHSDFYMTPWLGRRLPPRCEKARFIRASRGRLRFLSVTAPLSGCVIHSTGHGACQGYLSPSASPNSAGGLGASGAKGSK